MKRRDLVARPATLRAMGEKLDLRWLRYVAVFIQPILAGRDPDPFHGRPGRRIIPETARSCSNFQIFMLRVGSYRTAAHDPPWLAPLIRASRSRRPATMSSQAGAALLVGAPTLGVGASLAAPDVVANSMSSCELPVARATQQGWLAAFSREFVGRDGRPAVACGGCLAEGGGPGSADGRKHAPQRDPSRLHVACSTA